MGREDIVTLAGDSILVLDIRGGRATVLTADLAVVRTVAIPWPMAPAVRVGDKVVVSSFVPTPADAGWPLHMMTFDRSPAQILRSFGPDGGDFSNSQSGEALTWSLSPARDGGFWSADLVQYRIIQWTADGRMVRYLERRPAWFDGPQQGNLIGSPRKPPLPHVVGIAEDTDGLLWMFLGVAAVTWPQAWPAIAPGTSEIAARSIKFESLFGTTIEVVDPRAGRVVARRTIDECVIGALPGRRAAIYRVDSDGFPRIIIKRFDISGR
jgi:hypothetical protein